MAKTPSFYCTGCRFDSCEGTKIPSAARPKKKKPLYPDPAALPHACFTPAGRLWSWEPQAAQNSGPLLWGRPVTWGHRGPHCPVLSSLERGPRRGVGQRVRAL